MKHIRAKLLAIYQTWGHTCVEASTLNLHTAYATPRILSGPSGAKEGKQSHQDTAADERERLQDLQTGHLSSQTPALG